MFSDFANWIVIPCTATGANNLMLTPMSQGGGGIPTLEAYGYQNVFSFVAPATSTDLLFAQVGSLPQLPVYLKDGVTQAVAGKTIIKQPYWIEFNAALQDGAGGFFLLDLAASVAPTNIFIPSFATDLLIRPGSLGDTQWNVSALTATISNAAGTGNIQRNDISVFGDTTVVGLNGLDKGVLVANTWYYVWLIDNGSTPGVVLSLSFETPTLPTGYIYRMRVGALFIDGDLKLLKTLQAGNKATYVIVPGTNTPAMPQMAIGAAGNVNNPGWVAVQVRNGSTATTQYVPPTARSIRIAYRVAGESSVLVAPNPNYTGGSQPPIVVFWGASGSISITGNTEMVLEGSNIYWASGGTVPSQNALYALGWTDSAAVC